MSVKEQLETISVFIPTDGREMPTDVTAVLEERGDRISEAIEQAKTDELVVVMVLGKTDIVGTLALEDMGVIPGALDGDITLLENLLQRVREDPAGPDSVWVVMVTAGGAGIFQMSRRMEYVVGEGGDA